MADGDFPNAPQAFSFNGKDYTGVLIGFTGQAVRRFVLHEYPKRKGGRVEDMLRGAQRLEVRMVFIGPNCAQDYQQFKFEVDKNPFGTLVHPIFGEYHAFCTGPSTSVDFNKATNTIEVATAFVQSVLDILTGTIPNASSAAQLATTSQLSFEQAVATFIGTIAAAKAKVAESVAKVQNAILLVSEAQSAVIDLMLSTINTAGSINSSVLNLINKIGDDGKLLSQAITNYVAAATATDVFNGTDSLTSAAQNAATLLGVVLQSAVDYEALLISGSLSPAGAAEVVGQTDEAIASCLVLEEAIKADRPPLIDYRVPVLTDVISIATLRYPGDNAAVRASQILGLNRLPNPAAIPAGTVLKIYSK